MPSDFAEHVLGPFLEAVRVRRHVGLVVGPLGDPDVRDRDRERRARRRARRDPLAAEQLDRVVEVGVDVHDLDAGFVEPLPANRAFERAVGAAVRFGIARPEHDHLGFFEQVLDGPVGLRLADAHRAAPVMRRAPVPAFPAVGVVVHLGHADRVLELAKRGEVVADVAPRVMRRVAARDRAVAVHRLLPCDLGRDDVERLVPADALVTGDAAVLRVALAVRVEVDALHRVQDPVGRIDGRLDGLAVRGERSPARRRELLAFRFDRPRLRVVVVEIDRRHANDLAVLDVDEQRSAVGHVDVTRLAATGVDAVTPTGLEHRLHREHEPDGFVLLSVERHAEGLGRIDPAELVVRVRENLQPESGALDRDDDVGTRVDARARADFSVLDDVMAARPCLDSDLSGEVLLLEPLAERWMAPGGVLHRERDAVQQRRERQRAQSVHLTFPGGAVCDQQHARCTSRFRRLFSVAPQSLARGFRALGYGVAPRP